MKTFHARMMHAETGGEGSYQFQGPDDLMKKTADEIVAVFLDHVESEILRHHVDWEINAVFKNKQRGVVSAIGSLIPEKDDEPLPFLVMISEQNPG